MSACLQHFQWRSQRADLRSLHEPGRPDRKGMGRAGQGCRPSAAGSALAGSASGLAGSICGPGRTARRRGSSRLPSCPSPFWPACTASNVKAAAAWRHACARGPGQLCRGRQPLTGTQTRCHDCVEGDVGPRPLTTVEYWPSWRQGRWQRMDAPDHPAPLRPATRTWPLYWRDCVRS